MIYSIKTQKASLFAQLAHESINQKRKYSGQDYFTHCKEVAEIVKSTGANDDVISAAFLSDILEDVTPLNPHYSKELIKKEFGEKVLNLVIECTNVYTREDYPNLSRAERKNLEANRLEKVSDEAKLIKLADIISNLRDGLLENNREFAKVYFKEKLNLLGPLSDGNHYLLKIASDIILSGLKELEVEIPKVAVTRKALEVEHSSL